MHLDEASPHLHINFIPFYTQGRSNGLEKGVSMKAALDEQGFTGSNFKENRLVAWEESERTFMEEILHRHRYVRDDKQAHYAHMSVDEYKSAKEAQNIVEAFRRVRHVSEESLAADRVRQLQMTLQGLEHKVVQLETQQRSPYKSFFYSAPDKQSFVQTKLDELGIPYRETENGFEAQECYVDQIRRLEKQFKAPRTSQREMMRNDIDRLLMQSCRF